MEPWEIGSGETEMVGGYIMGGAVLGMGEGLIDLFGNNAGRVTTGMEGLGEVLCVGLKVLRMAADTLASDGQGV